MGESQAFSVKLNLNLQLQCNHRYLPIIERQFLLRGRGGAHAVFASGSRPVVWVVARARSLMNTALQCRAAAGRTPLVRPGETTAGQLIFAARSHGQRA